MEERFLRVVNVTVNVSMTVISSVGGGSNRTTAPLRKGFSVPATLLDTSSAIMLL